jgi:hypothetical protein
MNQQITNTGKLFVEEAKKLLVRGMLWSVIVAFVFVLTPVWDKITAVWNSTNDISVIRHDIHELEQTLRSISVDVARATGEDRVIRQTPGLSYVREPVYVGDNVKLYLVIQRTRLGALCRFLEAIPLFTDETGITYAGRPIPPVRQIGVESTRLRLDVIPPQQLQPGRVELYLDLEYDCAGVRTPDRTDAVIFHLLERE